MARRGCAFLVAKPSSGQQRPVPWYKGFVLRMGVNIEVGWVLGDQHPAFNALFRSGRLLYVDVEVNSAKAQYRTPCHMNGEINSCG